MSDTVFLIVVVGMLAVVIVPIVLVKRSMKRYLEQGALADAYVDAEKPFELTAPASGALDLMLRFGVERYRSGGSRVSRGLMVLIQAKRPPPDQAGGYRDDARGFELEREFLIGFAAKPSFGVKTEQLSMTYAVTKNGSIEMSTAVLARIPAGGPLTVQGRLAHTAGTRFQHAGLFVKPV